MHSNTTCSALQGSGQLGQQSDAIPWPTRKFQEKKKRTRRTRSKEKEEEEEEEQDDTPGFRRAATRNMRNGKVGQPNLSSDNETQKSRKESQRRRPEEEETWEGKSEGGGGKGHKSDQRPPYVRDCNTTVLRAMWFWLGISESKNRPRHFWTIDFKESTKRIQLEKGQPLPKAADYFNAENKKRKPPITHGTS